MRIQRKVSKFSALLLASGLLGGGAAWAAPVGYVPFNGTYSQDFDTLPYQSGAEINAAKPVTFSPDTTLGSAVEYSFPAASATPHDYSFSDATLGQTGAGLTTGVPIASGMDGWWGMATPVNATNGGPNSINYSQSSGQVTNKLGAQDGGLVVNQTGGIVSFGGLTSQNRSLGLFSTATVGAITSALALQNNTGAPISSVTISFEGELWNQESVQKYLNFSYAVAPLTSITSNANNGAAIPSATTTDPNLSLAYDTGATNTTYGVPVSSGTLSDTIALTTPWTAGSILWLQWQTFSGGTFTALPGGDGIIGTATGGLISAAGGGQELAFDNFSISVPEPTGASLMLLAVIPLFGRRRQRTK